MILTGADLTFLRAGECRDNFTVAVHFYVKNASVLRCQILQHLARRTSS